MKTTHCNSARVLLWSCATAAAFAAFQLTVSAATLTHRYSFNETSGITAHDSVGSADATVVNGTSGTALTSGQAWLLNSGNASSDTNGQYIALPPDLLTNYSAVTMEAWVTPSLVNSQWARVWDFGNRNAAGTGGGNAFFYARLGDNTGNSVEADSYVTGNGDNWNYATAQANDNAENHIVWTADANTHIAKLYLNGVLVSTIYNFTNSPAVVGSTTNDWLGRSQFGGDPLVVGSYNEFRIYDGAISALQVAADGQSGPDTYPASYGTVSGVALKFTSTSIGVGYKQFPQLMATASGLSAPVDIHDDPGVTWSSSDTNVATVDVHGAVTAVNTGTANIVANYGSLSATQAVTVTTQLLTLLHEYKFNETSGTTAHDSVGSANGTLNGNAAFSGSGSVLLDGTNSYVNLPSGMIDPTNITDNAVTLVMWGTAYASGGYWGRLIDFGDTPAGGGNWGYGYLYLAAGNGRLAVSQGTPGYQYEDGANGGNLRGKTNFMVVAVWNPNRKYMGVYENGSLTAYNNNARTPLGALVDVNCNLGKSAYPGDPYFAGEINEFRIYNGEMDRYQIGALYAGGVDSTNLSVGTPVGFALDAGTMPVQAGAVRTVQAYMNFTSATNVAVNGDLNLHFASSNPSVATVTDHGGALTTLNVGDTTISATFSTFTGGQTYNYTDSIPVHVALDHPGVLVHRYSFNETSGTAAVDSVGGANWNGTLMGDAVLNNGQVWLDGTNGTYVDLPAHILDATNGITSQAVTFEAWATFYPTQGAWTRLFDFGNIDGGVGANYIFCTPNGGGGYARMAVSDTDPGYNSEDQITWGSGLLGQTNIQVVLVWDPAVGLYSAYTNGVLAGSLTPTKPYSSVIDNYSYLGHSLYSADSWLAGSIDEFRIYNGVLTPGQIKTDYALGPNALPVNLPQLQAVLQAGNLLISWPTNNSSGFSLQSSGALGSGASWSAVSGTPTVVGGNYQMSVPITGTAQFFQLKK